MCYPSLRPLLPASMASSSVSDNSSPNNPSASSWTLTDPPSAPHPPSRKRLPATSRFAEGIETDECAPLSSLLGLATSFKSAPVMGGPSSSPSLPISPPCKRRKWKGGWVAGASSSRQVADPLHTLPTPSRCARRLQFGGVGLDYSNKRRRGNMKPLTAPASPRSMAHRGVPPPPSFSSSSAAAASRADDRWVIGGRKRTLQKPPSPSSRSSPTSSRRRLSGGGGTSNEMPLDRGTTVESSRVTQQKNRKSSKNANSSSRSSRLPPKSSWDTFNFSDLARDLPIKRRLTRLSFFLPLWGADPPSPMLRSVSCLLRPRTKRRNWLKAFSPLLPASPAPTLTVILPVAVRAREHR